MKSGDVDQLLMRYLDGKLTPTERVTLNRLLESDLDARNSLREIAMHAVCFADLAREEELARSRTRPAQPGPTGHPWSKPMLAVAAAVMMLACTATVWLARGRAELITVGQISGAVSWIAAGDSSRSTLQPGDQVREEPSASTGRQVRRS